MSQDVGKFRRLIAQVPLYQLIININIHVIEAYLDVSNRSHSFNVQFQVSPGSVDPSDVQIREARISKPSSSSLHETHRLYRYDKVT